ncbi:TlpA disulfide reductase family protein [Myroides guanonis]|uniref:Peroxiredoxin n=1 Tax=Myroides guanonis TaxID=1150112 RepID=A0A1I3TG46_9FLAO|nr:TlpA disulfide reductase family protein [Myroides guanonis]SFJ69885.1 Peroxiredoxin [Myroides guanonis]
MKKIFFILVGVFLIMTSCKQQQDSFTIIGKTTGINDGTTVVLCRHVTAIPDTVATTLLKDGKFEFKGVADKPYLASIKFDDDNRNTMKLILENGNITVHYDAKIMENTKANGTRLNIQYTEMQLGQLKIIREEEAFNEKAKILYEKAIENEDIETMNSLGQQKNEFQIKIREYIKDYINENNDDLLRLLLLYNYSIYNDALSPISKGVAYEAFNNLSTNMKRSELGIGLESYWRKEFSLLNGDKAPEFTAPDTEGKVISLKDNLGKITILDFWASWCAPCRAENPNVVKLYKKYHKKGLNIIGISVDENGEQWKSAIIQDSLPWIQVSNLKGMKDPIAKEYSIKSVPTVYILDENGIIIARDLRGKDLEERISKLLK